MNPAIWICILLPLFLLWTQQEEKNNLLTLKKNIRKHRLGGAEMNEMIRQMIGKECILYHSLNAQTIGTPIALEGNWLSVATKTGTEILNVDYVSRIREYPRTAGGKKKSIVTD